jgi:hypothetical protein
MRHPRSRWWRKQNANDGLVGSDGSTIEKENSSTKECVFLLKCKRLFSDLGTVYEDHEKDLGQLS